MRFVLYGLVFAAGAYLALHTPAGRATLLHVEAAGRQLGTNIVGNLSN